MARGVENLLVAGRCVSAEPDAFASVRVIGPCMLEGQAAAFAARLACKGDLAVGTIDVDRLRSDLTTLGFRFQQSLATPRRWDLGGGRPCASAESKSERA